MPTERRHIQVEGITVEVVRKPIRNLHLAVYPPDGRVRIAIPRHLDEDAARLAVATRLPWVRRKRTAVIEQSRESEREMVSGESHHVGGQRYRLSVRETDGQSNVRITNKTTLLLEIKHGTDREGRKAVLDRWYRDRLRERVPELVERWSAKIGVVPPDWRIKRMKTRWGSCAVRSRRIWLNLELAKKSDRCLEYIVVHELCHLIEKTHNARFQSLMDRHLPSWRTLRDELNRSPLGFEGWTY